MLAGILFVLASATAAIASPHYESIHQLVTRQALTSAQIPAACQSGCVSALEIYNACLSGNTGTCLSVCQTSTFNGFVGCFNCVIQNTPGATSTDYQQLQAAIGQLQTACNAAGQSVTGASSLNTAGAASASATGTGSRSAGAVASFTSVTSAIVVGGSSSIAAGVSSISISSIRTSAQSGGGVPSSIAGAASSASSIAATSSRSAGQAVALLPQGLFAPIGVALGAIGAGAALVL